MIAFRRPKVSPPTLTPVGSGGKRAGAIRSLKTANPTASVKFPAHWNEADVRGALYAFHGRVCAYCCDELPRNDRGDVEHFRPKSDVRENPSHGGYWWLAYEFSNLLVSCSLCNRLEKRKNSHFPLRPNGLHRGVGRSLAREPRALLEPSSDPVSDYLTIDFVDDLFPVGAANGLRRSQRWQVKLTTKMFKWNVDGRLVQKRIQVIDETLKLLDRRTPIDDAKLTEMAICYRPHAWVVRHLLREYAPALLPNPDAELRWLLAYFWAELSIELRLQKTVDASDEPPVKKAIDELLWAFATLWKDPPAMTPTDVETYLRKRKIDAQVRPLMARL